MRRHVFQLEDRRRLAVQPGGLNGVKRLLRPQMPGQVKENRTPSTPVNAEEGWIAALGLQRNKNLIEQVPVILALF